MAKRTVYLHLGPALPGIAEHHSALLASDALDTAGLAAPAVEQAAMDRAVVEIRRRHRELGLRRTQVEGAWAEVCRRAFRTARAGHDVVISQPGLAGAEPQQVALALDGLAGLRLHLVLTPPDGVAADALPALAGHWAGGVGRHGRIHVLPLAAGTTPDEFAGALAGLALAGRRPARRVDAA